MAVPKGMRSVLYGVLVGIWAIACGGGEEATPTPTVAPRPTAAVSTQPSPTPRPAATTAPSTPTAAPQPTPTPRPAPVATTTPRQAPTKLTVVVTTFGSESLDPGTAQFSTLLVYGAPLYDYGAWHGKDGTLAPGYFSEWQQSPDGKKWTFTLREMSFHNGSPVTATDVKFSWDRILTPAATSSYNAIWKGNLASVDAPSQRTVVANLKQPWPLMPFNLAPAGGGESIVLPKVAFEQQGGAAAFFRNPIGSGPFKFVRRDAGIRFVLEATGQKHPYREQPAYQTLEILSVSEESTRVAMLKTGAADLVVTTPESVPGLSRDRFQVTEIPNNTGTYLRLWGGTNPAFAELPVANVRVREALSLAVNKQEIVDTILGGLAQVPARALIPPGVEGFDPSWKPVPYDPERAKQLLAAAGYTRGLTIRLYNVALPRGAWTPRAGEAVAGYWSQVGVQTQLVPIEYGAWQGLYREDPQRTAMGAYGWIFSVTGPEMMRGVDSHYNTKGPLHFISVPAIDEAIAKASSTLDAQERVRLVRFILDTEHNMYTTISIAFTGELYASPKEKIASWDLVKTGGPGLSWELVKFK